MKIFTLVLFSSIQINFIFYIYLSDINSYILPNASQKLEGFLKIMVKFIYSNVILHRKFILLLHICVCLELSAVMQSPL